LSDRALAEVWRALRAEGRAALIPYVTAGHPEESASLAFLRGAASWGADMVELGIPFSDPVADGPVIQASTHAALEGGMTLERALELLAKARAAVPVVVFSYLNPILAFGPERFARAAREAGAAGILVTDLPAGEDALVEGALAGGGLPLVRMIAPTTPDTRIELIARASRGFVYLVARLGVTGESTVPLTELERRVSRVRAATDLPVAVGFGITSAEQAATVARFADGVVVGSAVVSRLESGGADAAGSWLSQVRGAMDRARSRP
jgi:tryptophan synthase alpha chain